MKIACFDMEGTLTPEIWEQVALDTGIEGLSLIHISEPTRPY